MTTYAVLMNPTPFHSSEQGKFSAILPPGTLVELVRQRQGCVVWLRMICAEAPHLFNDDDRWTRCPDWRKVSPLEALALANK